MQRKATKNTRAANADEKRFHAITKNSDCIVCGNPSPSIVNHCWGATFKHLKVLVGHWFVIPLCLECDNVITHGSRRGFSERFGTQSSLWGSHIKNTAVEPPFEVVESIKDWNQ